MSNSGVQDIYPLTPIQHGMLYHMLSAPDQGIYHAQMHCILEGALNVAAFKQAWQTVVQRHGVFRTAFVWEGVPEPLQVVQAHVELPFHVEDWQHLTPAEQDRRLADFLDEDRRRGFDPAQAPLIRLTLFQLGEHVHRLVWSHHHLLMDGWSLPLVLRDILTGYGALSEGHAVDFGPVRPFGEYIEWLQKQDLAAAEVYWRRTMRGFTKSTPLGLDEPAFEREDRQGYDEQHCSLPRDLTARLKAFAAENHLTLNTVVHGAWGILLNRYSGHEDIVYGMTVSGRPASLDGVESMVGMFINTLPMRIGVRADAPLLEWLTQLQAIQTELREFEYTPLPQLQGWSDVPRGVPLFESILVFENYPDEAVDSGSLGLRIRDTHSLERANYPMTVLAVPQDEFIVKISYSRRRFPDRTVARILGHFATVLESMVSNPHQELGAVSIMPPDERKLLDAWNNTGIDYGAALCVHQVFEAQVVRRPNAVAVAYGDATLTYRQLNARANQLAHHLRAIGVKRETPVGICVERSVEMLVGMLGVLKAGGAFVPLDPTYPAERLAFMLQDSQVPVLLTQQRLVSGLPLHTAEVLCLDTDLDALVHMPTADPTGTVSAENLAYIVYTSGSTGRPKGVLVEHRGLRNVIAALVDLLAVDADSRVLQYMAFGFDASVSEVFMALTTGATLHVAESGSLLPGPELIAILTRNAITNLTVPPSVLAVLPAEELPALRTIIAVGEVCSADIVSRWASGRRFLNGYGPTEATIGATAYLCHEGDVKPPIGRPFPNTQIYLLDEHMQPVPIGAPGEMFIGGVGVARGYLNRADLTAEKFLANPFSADGQTRLYRTGDKARYRTDGNLEFCGRIDHQVKIHGRRIEPGEIESVLMLQPFVREAVVLAREVNADKRLVAFLLADGESSLNLSALRTSLRKQLPDYMIPVEFVIRDAFPLTPNGKVDRNALNETQEVGPAPGQSFVAPRNHVEEILAGIWADVLQVDSVGVYDNFFELGIHSLIATLLVSRVREAFQVELPLNNLFEALTVAVLAERVQELLSGEATRRAPALEKIERSGELPLSFAQLRLWFVDQLDPGNPSYNIPVALRLEGPLHVKALTDALTHLIERHETLRTNFQTVDGEPVQVIRPAAPVLLPEVDLRVLAPSEREAKVIQLALAEASLAFDLSHDRLIRTRLVRVSEDEHVLLLTVHHIISDGWSGGVLVRELAALYEAFALGRRPELPVLPIQYADFAYWQRAWLSGPVLDEQLAYWREQLAKAPPVLDFPTDYMRPTINRSVGSQQRLDVPAELSDQLKALSRQEGVTVFMTLLAAFKALLFRYTQREQIVVGTPVANRNRIEIEGLMGCFVNTLALHTHVRGDLTFRELLSSVRAVCLGAYAHQDLPFEKLVETLHPERDMSHHPIFQVMFVLQNTPTESLELPGLTATPMSLERGVSRFDLTLEMSEGEQGMCATLIYNTDLFRADTIERLLGHFAVLLGSAVTDPDRPIAELPMMSEDEGREILVQWNDTSRYYPDAACLHETIAAQAERSPNAIAVICEDERITYRALNQRANQVAHFLRRAGVGLEDLVGIYTEPSIDMVVAVLGVLKAGAAYLPLDTAFPPGRVAAILADARPLLLLTHERFRGQLPTTEASVIALDLEGNAIAQESDQEPELCGQLDNLAYVIYTSGSTGAPKGVMVAHRNIHNHIAAINERLGFVPQASYAMVQSLAVDGCKTILFGALCSGGTLHLISRGRISDPSSFGEYMQAYQIECLKIAPSHLAALMVSATPERVLPKRWLIMGGEPSGRDFVHRIHKLAPECLVMNHYGPTETTVGVITHLAERHSEEPDPTWLPLGRPLANTQVYLLDRHLQPVPIGVPGEILIGGTGVSRGYLNRPDLTEERFIPNPFSEQSGDQLYRTGDIAKYAPNGDIYFIGRTDDQVKIRGFRVELEEIENVLRQNVDVREAVVIARQDAGAEKRLAAYLIPAGSRTLSVSDIRAYLATRLPDYMVPASINIMDTFPHTPQGKVDRPALPAPSHERPDIHTPYVPPRTQIEAKLIQLWSEVLGLEQVGTNDNFFELGGHSLLAIKLVQRVRSDLHCELPVRSMFLSPTVSGMAQIIGASEPLRAQVPAGAPSNTRASVKRETSSGSQLVSPRLEGLREKLLAGDDTALSAFWCEVAEIGTPLVENIPGEDDHVWLSFIWRAEAAIDSVHVLGGVAGWDFLQCQMHCLMGSDLWYKTYRVRKDAGFNYGFRVNMGDEEWQLALEQRELPALMPDPYHRAPNQTDSMPWMVALPDAPQQPWEGSAGNAPAGLVEEHLVSSETLGNERRVWVYLPPGYGERLEPHHLLVLLDGAVYLQVMKIPAVLDRAHGEGRIPPTVVVMVEALDDETRRRELSCHAPHGDFLASELLPWIAERYRVARDPEKVTVGGFSLAGLAAVFTGLQHSNVIGNVICQSGALWWSPAGEEEPGWLLRQVAATPARSTRVYLEVGLMETMNLPPLLNGPNQISFHRHMRDVLTAKGYRVRYQEYNGGHDPMWWRLTIADALSALAVD